MKNYLMANRRGELGYFTFVKDLREFDERYTARLCGFKDRDDYYRTCSSRPHLANIKVPSVIITAEDDPFISVEDYRSATYSPQTVLHIEKHGGHVGYLAGSGRGYMRWLDNALGAYIQTMSAYQAPSPRLRSFLDRRFSLNSLR